MTRNAVGRNMNAVQKSRNGTTPSHDQPTRGRTGRAGGVPRSSIGVSFATGWIRGPGLARLLDVRSDDGVPLLRDELGRGVQLIELGEYGPLDIGQLGELLLGDLVLRD